MDQISIPDLENTNIWEIARMTQSLKAKKFFLKDLGIPNKTYHDWRNVDIVPPEHIKKEGEGNMELTFTFYEWLWFQILKDLRELGINFKNLKTLRDNCWLEVSNEMFEEANSPENIERNKKNSKAYNKIANLIEKEEKNPTKGATVKNWIPASKLKKYVFEFLVFDCIMEQKETKILYRYDGFVGLLTDFPEIILKGESEPFSLIKFYNKEFAPYPHFSFPISLYLKKFFTNPDNIKYLPMLGFVNEDEQEVLEVIKSGNLKELTVKFDKSKNRIKGYEFKKDGDISEEEFQNLIRTFYLKDYESVAFKRKNNKTVYFERTTTKQMNK